jgi:polar amino acid transport system ATP-binding protein
MTPTADSMPADADPEATGYKDVVRVRDVSKSYGATRVLSDFSINVRSGEHVALIGPSGSGKTTVLRVIIGLERPDQGTVEIAGRSLWHSEKKGRMVPASEKHLRDVRRSVGIVFQHFNLFPHMSALDNVALAPRRVLGMGREEAAGRARELLTMVGLSNQVSNTPAQLSGGQQQRVAIARALALQPKVMLFDEVTSALDPELVNEVLHVMRELALHSEMTMLIVTHEMDFAAEIANRMLMFDGGKVIEEGRPRELLKAPKHERTQRFLQSIIDRRGV